MVNGRATVIFRAPHGACQIERSAALNTWEPLTTRYAGEPGGTDFADENAPEAKAFYRAVPLKP